MKTKLTFLTLVALLALVLSACQPAPQQPYVRSMTVNGMGQVSLKPDIAYIYIGVHTESPSAATAVSENNAKSQKLIDALGKAGIAADDIRTTSFSIWPNQQYSPEGQPLETKYMVDNTVYVTVRDISKLGDILDGAVKAGANTINSITFDVTDKTAAINEARKAAVTAARAQANELAAAAGITLGAIQGISYYDNSPVPMPVEGKGMGGGGMAADMAVPINPGQLQITVNVSITYEIK